MASFSASRDGMEEREEWKKLHAGRWRRSVEKERESWKGKRRRQKEEMCQGVSSRKNWATEHNPGRIEKRKKMIRLAWKWRRESERWQRERRKRRMKSAIFTDTQEQLEEGNPDVKNQTRGVWQLRINKHRLSDIQRKILVCHNFFTSNF